jgi:hypothetical protein
MKPPQVDPVELANASAIVNKWRTLAEATARATIEAIAAGVLSTTTLARIRRALDESGPSLFDTKETR